MSYTMDLVNSMMLGLIDQKLEKGYIRLNNGLFEDVAGQVFTIVLEKSKVTLTESTEVYSIIKLQMKPVSVAGRI